MADEKIIFSMNGVGKILPHNNKVILKDIYLSFFYGAKIGIVGMNGAGKSTLMKIIAGIDNDYQGMPQAPLKVRNSREWQALPQEQFLHTNEYLRVL